MARKRLLLFVSAVPLAVLAVSLAFLGCGKPPPPPPEVAPVIPGGAEPAGPPLFDEVTKDSGIDFTYRNGEEADNYAIIESLGGGVALLDYDGDGLLDIFIGGGGKFDGQKVLGLPGKLYRNLGGFKFQDTTADVGLSDPLQYSHGASAFDYDRDGWPDLLVSGYNRLILLHNEAKPGGGRRFVDTTKKSGLDTDTLWSTSTAWGDLNGDGYPELYVCHYANWGFSGKGPDGQDYRHPTDCKYPGGAPKDVCQPGQFTPLPHKLYRNNGDGTFTDISPTARLVDPKDPKKNDANGVPGPLREDGRGIGVVIADFDNDARPDIYTANDTDHNFLYLSRGAKFGPKEAVRLFEDGLLGGVAVDDGGAANGSMGIGVGDFDRSGRASLLVTNYENELPALYQNVTKPGAAARFGWATQKSGLGRIQGKFVSWGTGFADFDLNGWEDVYIVNGHAIRHPGDAKGGRKQQAVLLLNDDGNLKVETARGGSFFAEAHNCRGTAVGDLDNDGRPDMVVVRHNDPVVVLKNVATAEGKHWVGVKLAGKEHRDLVGSRVVLETTGGKQTRFVKGGASYGSTDDPRLHFGLGADDKITKATVFWSHGGSEEISGLGVGKYSEVAEGNGKGK